MVPKGGSGFLLLLIAYVVSAMQPGMMPPMSSMMPDRDPSSYGFPAPPPRFRDMAKKLMMKCLQMGHQVPMVMDNHFNNSGMPMEERLASDKPPAEFVSLLSSLPPPDTDTDTDRAMEFPNSDSEWNATERLWNCSSLPHLIQLIRNTTNGTRCFLRAFVAPLSWVALTMKGGDNLDREDLGRLLWASKPLLQNMPLSVMSLPPNIHRPQLEEMMKMLSEVFGSLSEEQRVQIKEWVKERVIQNYYNCSMSSWRPKPKSRPRPTTKPGQRPKPGPFKPAVKPESERDREEESGVSREREKEVAEEVIEKKPLSGRRPSKVKPNKKKRNNGDEERKEKNLSEEREEREKSREQREEVEEKNQRNEDHEGGNEKRKEKKEEGIEDGLKEEDRNEDQSEERRDDKDKEDKGEKNRESEKQKHEEWKKNNLWRKGEGEKEKEKGENKSNKEMDEQRKQDEKERESAIRYGGPPIRRTDEENNSNNGEQSKEREEEENKKERENEREREKERDEEGDTMPGRCPPGFMWLKTVEVMKMMGPFLTRLPIDDIKTIPKDELCSFFRTPQFRSSFRGVGTIQPAVGRKMFHIVSECSPNKQEFTQHLDRLGSLACFYDDASPLNSSLSKLLLSQLDDCSNSGVTKLKKKLVKTVMSSFGDDASPKLLSVLGSGVTVLPAASLSRFPTSALKHTLDSLGPNVKWHLSQAQTLAKKILQGKEAVSGEELMSLGPAVKGVASALLKKAKAKGLLGSENLQSMSQRMSKLQRTALLEGLRGDVNASELVKRVPASLLSRLSLNTLDRANLTSPDQLEGKKWTRAQSAFLVRKILGQKLRPQDMRKLGSAMQGVACQMIDKIAESDVMEMAQALTETPRWLSKTQVCCAAKRLYGCLEKERPGYLQNITDEELEDIPTLLLLHMPAKKIESLPDSVCPVFLEKMSEANLSSLPLSSRSRPALTSRALRCLVKGRNMSDLPSEEVEKMGPLLCELAPSKISLMAPEALNSTLKALASCTQIPLRHRRRLLQMVNDTYGDPSDWSADTMESLGPLLLLDNSSILSLRVKPWLKATLSDLRDSLPTRPTIPPPQEFHSGPDRSVLSALRQKLFSLSISDSLTQTAVMPSRRKREVVGLPQVEAVPSVSVIEDLGDANICWSPAQLSTMSVDTFTAAVETLGAIPDYSAKQLGVLRQKSIEAWGPVAGLNESQVLQMGCITQGLILAELSSLPISSLDTLEALAPCAWTQQQREAVWRAFVGRTGMTVDKLGAVELVGLYQFVCGLSSAETAQLNSDAFCEAVESIGQVQCPLVVTERLKVLAVNVFGEPSNWTEAQVNILGNIMAGLSSSELGSLNLSVLPFLTQTSIPLIPTDRLATLSVSQLEALGPDNSAMVTIAQRESLGEEQRVALGNALGLPYTRADQPTPNPPSNLPQQSGASLLGTLGVGVTLQPFLLLLLGFVLQ